MSCKKSSLITALFIIFIFPLVILNHPAEAAPQTIKISHQFPGGTIDEGDFRDRICRKFGAEVEKRTKGQLKFEVYPSNSLMKTDAQLPAMRKGALDMGLVPLSYIGGEIPETNLGLMPTLVTSYEQGLRWKNAPIGKELSRILADKNIIILTWIWQGGGIASTKGKVVRPDDVKGMKFRGGSKEMDLMLKTAGAAITGMPSSELYSAMQSGVLDATLTSSTSLISYRLYEFTKNVTTARNKTFWYMLEPLLIAKNVFDKLTPEQQKIIMDVGASLETFGIEESRKDDQKMADVYAKAGANVHDMDEASFNEWRELARQSSFKDFVAKVKNGQALLDMATSVK
jgi:TRAP-type C4-dicarboxylate transport system substrate-binding protein